MFGSKKRNEVHVIYHGARERRAKAQLVSCLVILGIVLLFILCSSAWLTAIHH